MNTPTVLGIDLGGTKIAAALITGDGQLLWEDKIPTNAAAGFDEVLSRITGLVSQAMHHGILAAIGLGVPGLIDQQNGVVSKTPNLDWINVPIVSILEGITGITVCLENDANAAALGEQYFGAGRGIRDLIYITVSTGIGGGIIINNQVVRGKDGGAGELGHMMIVENGPLCGCGRSGCLETVASGTAITRMMLERLKQNEPSKVRALVQNDLQRVDTAIIAQAAQHGDPLAQEVIRTAMNHLAKAIANLVTLLNPEMVIIGGGVSNIGTLMFDPIHQWVQTHTFPEFSNRLAIVPAALGGQSGVLGAAAVALQTISRSIA